MVQEEPEPDPCAVAAAEDADPTWTSTAHPRMSARVASSAPDQGLGEGGEEDAVAADMGIDGAGASAEDATVNLSDNR